MPTRFHFEAANAGGHPVPTLDAGWGSTTGFARRKLLSSRKGEAITGSATATLPNTAGTAAVGANVLNRVYVSQALEAQSITTSHVLSCQIMASEGATTHNVDAMRAHVYVVSNDGLTIRGTLLAIGQHGTVGNEFSTAARNCTVITPGTASQNNVSVQLGDRLVIAMGGYTSVGGTATPTMTTQTGDAASDLPVDDTTTTSGAGWFEISSTLAFVGAAGGVPNLPWSAFNGTVSSAALPSPSNLAWVGINASSRTSVVVAPISVPWTSLNATIRAAVSTTPPTFGWSAFDGTVSDAVSTTPPQWAWTGFDGGASVAVSTTPPSFAAVALDATELAVALTTPADVTWVALATGLVSTGVAVASTTPVEYPWIGVDGVGSLVASTLPAAASWTAFDASTDAAGFTTPPDLAWTSLDARGLDLITASPVDLAWTALDASTRIGLDVSPGPFAWSAVDASCQLSVDAPLVTLGWVPMDSTSVGAPPATMGWLAVDADSFGRQLDVVAASPIDLAWSAFDASARTDVDGVAISVAWSAFDAACQVSVDVPPGVIGWSPIDNMSASVIPVDLGWLALDADGVHHRIPVVVVRSPLVRLPAMRSALVTGVRLTARVEPYR